MIIDQVKDPFKNNQLSKQSHYVAETGLMILSAEISGLWPCVLL